MKSKSHRLIYNSRSRRTFNRKKHSSPKAWVIKAIAQEETHSSDQMWKKEPTAEYQFNERLRRIRFLRKHGKTDPELLLIADCLEQCEPRNRCYSGACPECGRLFQRFYVRQSKGVIRDIIEHEGRQLIALCIIPSIRISSSRSIRQILHHQFSASNKSRPRRRWNKLRNWRR